MHRTYLAAIAILGACGQPVDTQPAQGSLKAATVREPAPDVGPPVDVSAETLWSAYESNEIGADAKYKGRVLNVIGRVHVVQKDIVGQPQIMISTPDPFGRISASFPPDQAADLAKLSVDQKIAVRCVGSGQMMGIVALSKCRLMATW